MRTIFNANVLKMEKKVLNSISGLIILTLFGGSFISKSFSQVIKHYPIGKNLAANTDFWQTDENNRAANGWMRFGEPEGGKNERTIGWGYTVLQDYLYTNEQRYPPFCSHHISVTDRSEKKRYWVSQIIPDIEPNEWYTLSVYIKTDALRNGWAFPSVEFLDEKQNVLKMKDGEKLDGKYLWKRKQVTAKSPPETKFCRISLVMDGVGNVWFDAVQLERGQASTDYEPGEREIWLTGKGEAVIEPNDKVTVNTYNSWKITYTVPKEGIVIGGGLRITNPYIFSFPQFEAPSKEGYITVSTTNLNSNLRLEMEPFRRGFEWSYMGPQFLITVEKNPLKERDRIIVNIGDRTGGGPGTKITNYNCWKEFTIESDLDGNHNYARIPHSPRVFIEGEQAVKFYVAAHSDAVVGETFTVSIRATDRFGNPDPHYTGTIYFSSDNSSANLPSVYTFKENDEGIRRFSGIYFNEPGIHTIRVKDVTGKLFGESNPIRVSVEEQKYKIYWGDLHGHTWNTDGLGTWEEYYQYGRDISFLDIAMPTDHDIGMQYLSNEDWEEIRRLAKKYYEPGKFVTFSAYEWTGKRGHKNVYYFDDEQDIYRTVDPDEGDSPDALFSTLRNLPVGNVIVVPHHPCARGLHTDWDFHDSLLQRLVEIVSSWGISETEDGYPRPLKGGHYWQGCVQEALKRGIRIGFVGGSDSHIGHPGNSDFHRWGEQYHNGLTGILATGLTREEMWDALWNRRTFATTDIRIILEVSLNGRNMGEEFFLPATKKRKLSVSVFGVNNIEKAVVVKNCKDIFTKWGDGRFLQFEYTDPEKPGREDYYYVRIFQTDGEMAWSSPIWIMSQ